jgi:phosphatidylglycerophosphate synthase
MSVAGIALVTDFVDGYLARRWGLESETGYLLDGLGDKVFYAAVLLVITREGSGQAIIAWALIARELVWYGVRAVSVNRLDLKFMRALSVAYALVIRLYFFGFVIIAWYAVSGISTPYFLEYYGVIGLAAVAIGSWQIGALSKVVMVDLERTHADRR